MYYLGLYESIDRLGSLVVRIVLAPLEESAALHFESQIPRASPCTDAYSKNQSPSVAEDSKAPIPVIEEFITIVHLISIVGLVVATFAPPYSSILLTLYGGKVLADSEGLISH